jgi:hypothetical protein
METKAKVKPMDMVIGDRPTDPPPPDFSLITKWRVFDSFVRIELRASAAPMAWHPRLHGFRWNKKGE